MPILKKIFFKNIKTSAKLVTFINLKCTLVFHASSNVIMLASMDSILYLLNVMMFVTVSMQA